MIKSQFGRFKILTVETVQSLPSLNRLGTINSQPNFKDRTASVLFLIRKCS